MNKIEDNLKSRIEHLEKELIVKNRELEVEAALEKVRSRTMSMHKSGEVMDVAGILFEEVQKLGFTFGASSIIIMDKESGDTEYWIAGFFQQNFPESYHVPFFDHPYHNTILSSWKNGERYLVYNLAGEEKKAYDEILFTETGYKNIPEEEKKWMRATESVVFSLAFMKYGAIHWGPSALLEDQANILQRFAQVFEQSYTRFLDLQKAEAQAREAQIEAALERVRSKTMAMHKSDELLDTSRVLFEQFKYLGQRTDQLTIGIVNESDGVVEIYATVHGHELPKIFRHDVSEPYVMNKIFNGWKSGKKFLALEMSAKEIEAYNQYRNQIVGTAIFATQVPPDQKRVIYASYFSKGMLALGDSERPPAETKDILDRFAKVFEQTYTRFLDLQKAEAQAREAQIEAGLERVRSRAMAMQSSDELNALIGTVFTELTKLDIKMIGCVIMIFDRQTYSSRWWMVNSEAPSEPINFFIKNHKHNPYQAFLQAWEKKEKKWQYELKGKEKKEWDEFLFTETELANIPAAVIAAMRTHEKILLSTSFNNFGCLNNGTSEPLTDEQFDILLRFARVFDLTYTRFNDLKQAEAQAREARIEAALEKVRSRSMAMQKSDELAPAAQVLYQEFNKLGINTFTCGYMFIDEETNTQTAWVVLPDGTLLPNFIKFPLRGDDILNSRFEDWKAQKLIHIYEITGEINKQHHRFLSNHVPSFVVEEIFSKMPDRIIFHCANFSVGYLLILAEDYLTAEEQQTIIRFANVFEMTYTRFLDLQNAESQAEQARLHLIEIEAQKNRAEQTLTELRSTQAQLIQSEKMASLGELTAGIAHEIQNPLNFVKNFSEVNLELIEEVKSERFKVKSAIGNDEQDELLNDIAENLMKISFHSNRADAIVKNMLQHSSKSAGQKDEIDINALVDEYLRLSYHGFRAKDNSFNCILETNLDSAIGKLNLNSQEIGRVLLNLFNNAFYAVHEKKKTAGMNYEPKVSVSTHGSGKVLVINVKDNGTGIPEKVLEKIYQPFFTTKPTGEGTGLGLSLSYDIITKGHSGEIKVETKEGEGSEFIIHIPAFKPVES